MREREKILVRGAEPKKFVKRRAQLPFFSKEVSSPRQFRATLLALVASAAAAIVSVDGIRQCLGGSSARQFNSNNGE